EVWNKADLLAPEDRAVRLAAAKGQGAVLMSAATGEGVDVLLAAIEAALSANATMREVVVAPQDGALLAWLYRNVEVLARDDGSDGAHLTIRIPEARLADTLAKLGEAPTHEEPAPQPFVP
ncbi:MAG: GTPase HflX, partial [Pseudomonadota bacterium]